MLQHELRESELPFREHAKTPILSPASAGLFLSPPAEKATARQNQAGQASTGDGFRAPAAGVAKIAPPTLPSRADVASVENQLAG
jgi:hypothetical protein